MNKLWAILLPLIITSPSLCFAGLINDTVQFDGCFPNNTACTDLGTQMVTADASDAVTYGVSTTDVNDSTIVFSAGANYGVGVSFNGVIVSDLDWAGEPNRILSGFTVLSDTFTDLVITFTDDTISFNAGSSLNAIPGAQVGAAGSAEVQLLTSLRDPDGSVPAPATLALLGLGLAGIGYRRRKHIKAA